MGTNAKLHAQLLGEFSDLLKLCDRSPKIVTNRAGYCEIVGCAFFLTL
jgi:hypothetical protein